VGTKPTEVVTFAQQPAIVLELAGHWWGHASLEMSADVEPWLNFIPSTKE
jgi:hypothetical protein